MHSYSTFQLEGRVARFCAVSKLSTLAEKTLADVWYPFTQHSGLEPKDVTVIDARSSEDMLVFKPGGSQNFSPRIELQYDACASWWTQVFCLYSWSL